MVQAPNSTAEVFQVTPQIRYKKRLMVNRLDLWKTQDVIVEDYRMQQLWEGSNGTQDWRWVEYID